MTPPLQNMHLTLRFAGDISNAEADEFCNMLEDVEVLPFELQQRGVGVFGGSKPHSLHALVPTSPELRRLHAVHESIARKASLKPETRKFAPHVTLARVRSSPADAIRAYAEQHAGFTSRRFTVQRFVVLSSRPSRGGGPYALEQAYDLDLMM